MAQVRSSDRILLRIDDSATTQIRQLRKKLTGLDTFTPGTEKKKGNNILIGNANGISPNIKNIILRSAAEEAKSPARNKEDVKFLVSPGINRKPVGVERPYRKGRPLAMTTLKCPSPAEKEGVCYDVAINER